MGESESEDAAALTVFALLCLSAMLFLIQGVAFFYAGLAAFGSALTHSAYSMLALSVCILQFFFLGWTLINSTSYGPLGWFIGGLDEVMMYNMPDSGYNLAKYLSTALLTIGFCSVAASLMIGATSQRGRLLPSLVFLAIWLTLVYDPIAYWCWNSQGWSYRLGALDYAGGTAVHCTAGVTALVYSLMLGPRSETANSTQLPFSLFSVVAGTFMMWVGWFGFNSGAAMGPSSHVMRTVFNTQLSASAGGLTWMIVDHSFDSEWSIVGFCSGVISGLVCVTPGAAYVPSWASIIFGIVGSLACNFGTKFKFYLSADDSLDIFAVHGVGGFCGSILTGVFASPKWSRRAGLVFGNFEQVFLQLASAIAIVVYTGVMSTLILRTLNKIPGLHLRIPEDLETVGLDLVEHGEVAFSPVDSQSIPGSSSTLSRTEMGVNKYKQTHLNVSMFPDLSDSPLLQRPSVSYGSATGYPR